jgi:hypothetical protein
MAIQPSVEQSCTQQISRLSIIPYKLGFRESDILLQRFTMDSVRMAEMLYMQYLGLSVQSELSRQLSDKGKVFLPGSKEFENSNNRFTQYERPVQSQARISHALFQL